ncbi:hypothetical protein K9M48_03455 [Candidatus Gracilibacteria bacterium]|nr:hypothetical protein [Candidatus Gracilibacteria bacterium]
MKKTTKKKIKNSDNLTLTRRQILIFEISMISGGALFTMYLPEFFGSIKRLLWILLVVPGLYICFVHFKQTNK